MNRNDLMRIYFFGGGSYSPPPPTYATKKQKVTKWRHLETPAVPAPESGEGAGGQEATYTYSNVEMKGEGWEPYEEEITVLDTAEKEEAIAAEAAKKEEELAKKRRGRASTILTKPGSVMGEPTLRKASLLGSKQRFGE